MILFSFRKNARFILYYKIIWLPDDRVLAGYVNDADCNVQLRDPDIPHLDCEGALSINGNFVEVWCSRFHTG